MSALCENDFTISYDGKLYQIKDAVKSQKVTVEERIDGSLHITNKGLDLRYSKITTPPAKENLKPTLFIQGKKDGLNYQIIPGRELTK